MFRAGTFARKWGVADVERTVRNAWSCGALDAMPTDELIPFNGSYEHL